MQGKELINCTFNAKDKKELDVSNLLTGIYLIKIQYKEGFETKKLVIQ